MTAPSALSGHRRRGTTDRQGPPAHPPGPTYPCCLPALGGFSGMTPHEGSAHQGSRPAPVASPAEDSPSGLGRTIGNRVGLTPSGVQIPYPPPRAPSGVL